MRSIVVAKVMGGPDPSFHGSAAPGGDSHQTPGTLKEG